MRSRSMPGGAREPNLRGRSERRGVGFQPGLLMLLLSAILAAADVPAIHFANGYALDRDGITPPPPSELAAGDSARSGSYWIVRFRGPVQHNWLDQLSGLGASPVAYLPHQAAVVRLNRAGRAQFRDLDFVADLHPFEPVYKIPSGILDLAVPTELSVVPFPDHNVDSLARVIDGPAARVKGVSRSVITVRADGSAAARLARLDAVEWIQRKGEGRSFDEDVQWVMQVGWQPAVPPDSSGRRIWYKGLRGQGLVLGVSDVGLNVDHEMLADPEIPIRAPGVFLHHRKILAYKLYEGARYGDETTQTYYHGTRVTGIVAGNDAPYGNNSTADGLAPDARVYFLDVFNGTGLVLNPGADFTGVMDSIYPGRGTGNTIVQSSMSWGTISYPDHYLIEDATTDAYAWSHPEFLTIWAVGNLAQLSGIAHAAASKDGLGVGGTGNGVWSDTLFLGGVHGPTRDGRIKPDLVAPAINVWSASGPGPAVYAPLTGTSAAAPAVNAACGLIRQYLGEGWYPTGQTDPTHRIGNPSSALMRALAVVGTDPNVSRQGTPLEVPDEYIGWGRMDIDSTLFFPGDERRLFLVDDRQGVATGETLTFHLNVTGQIPLRAVLAWTDTAGAPNPETSLVNNLDLEVRDPSRPHPQRYRGNKYAGGESVQNPPGWDSVNTVECFRLNAPVTGIWEFLVIGSSVFTARQPFALAVTGALPAEGIAEPPGLVLPLAVAIRPNPVRSRLTISCAQAGLGRSELSVYDASGRCKKVIQQGTFGSGWRVLDWDLTGESGQRIPAGVYFLKLRAADSEITRKFVVMQ